MSRNQETGTGPDCGPWAKPGKTSSEEGVYELFLTGEVVGSQKGEVREELPSRECRELCRTISKTSGHSIGLEGDVCGVSR